MSLPATNYATATLVNPTAALTDFTLLVDLSRMPAEWWAAVDTTDGTRGRAAKGDGTELAVDWIDFDSVNETGWARVKWSGTLATTGAQVLRVYPPKAANAAVAAGGTFGRHAAYDASVRGYWPDAGPTDRTSNALNGTASGITAGAQTGKVGSATAYSVAASSQVDFGASNSLTNVSGLTEFGVRAWFRDSSATGGNSGFERTILSNHAFSAYAFRAWRNREGTLRFDLFNNGVVLSTSGAVNDGTWKHAWFQKTPTALEIYRNGVLLNSLAYTDPMPAGLSNRMHIGRVQQGTLRWDGDLDEVSFEVASRSAAWIAQEFEQSDDQATFWGVWSDNPVSGGARRRAMVIG